MSPLILVDLPVFLSVATLAWLILARPRSMTVSTPEAHSSEGVSLDRGPGRIFLALVARGIAKTPVLGRWFAADERQTAVLLRRAGGGIELTPGEFLALRLVAAVAAFLLLSLWMKLSGWTVLAGTLIAFLLPKAWLGRVVKKRLRRLALDLPRALDTLSLVVCAGLDFNRALDVLLENQRASPLGDEFRRVRGSMRLGISRQEAFRAMADQLDSQPVTHFVTEIIHTERTGGSLSEFLRKQSADLRDKRLHEAEKLAQTAPLRVIPPMALFSLPCLFIVIFVPVILRALEALRG